MFFLTSTVSSHSYSPFEQLKTLQTSLALRQQAFFCVTNLVAHFLVQLTSLNRDKMRFARFSTTAAVLAARSASAFSPVVATARRTIHRSRTTQLAANVLKLTDPATQLLNAVDVFIFDCDGVIWRVRMCMIQFLWRVLLTACFVDKGQRPSITLLLTFLSFLTSNIYN